MAEKLKGSLGADGKVWCIPCEYTKPIVGGRKFGKRQIFGGYGYHKGVDLSNAYETPIYAVKDGKVVVATYSDSAGNYIIIDHEDGTKSAYLHLGVARSIYPNKTADDYAWEKEQYKNRWLVKLNEKVTQGQHIGHMGSTGRSTGPHLHFGVQKVGHYTANYGNYVDPMDYIGGIKCDLYIDPDNSPFIPDDLRIENFELPTDSNWEPMNWKSGSIEGSPKMTLIKRNAVLGNMIQPVFNAYDNHIEICNGFGTFGLNSVLKSIPSVDKDAAMSAYSTKQPDGSFGPPYRLGQLPNEGQQIIAAYIYSRLSAYGWTHNAIIALLANIRAESGLNPARWESDTDWSSQPGISRGFGLIQWTPWNKFYNDLPEGYEDPYDIDAQIQGIIDYHASSYTPGRNSKVGDTYEQNLKDDPLWKNNTHLTEYSTSDGNDYYFPISKKDFIGGIVTTSVELSALEKVYILTVAYTYNAERPGEINASSRCSNADYFLKLFGEDGSAKLTTPSIETSDFWEIAKNQCKYTNSGAVIKNNESYCISRANEILGQIYGEEKKDFIIPKGTEDWFEYNKTKLKYDYGTLPRLGSIICYKSAENKDSKIAVVESVIGTHCIRVTSYDASIKEESDRLINSRIINTSHNWGEDKNGYVFQGFIYLIHDLNIQEYTEDIDDDTSNNLSTQVYKDKEGNLVIDVNNKTVKDKYVTLMFSLLNVKHINGMELRYEALQMNSSKEHTGNQLNLCLAQQVWNCIELGPLIDTTDEDYVKVNEELQAKWPYTYFPYKKKDDNSSEDPKTDPYRYNAPFPLGNLTIDNIAVKENKDNSKEIVRKYDLYEYVENGVTYDCYDSSKELNRMIRNHPGYLCIIVKAPKLSEDDKKHEYTHTRVIIKEILING